jgi:hypothetical protein
VTPKRRRSRGAAAASALAAALAVLAVAAAAGGQTKSAAPLCTPAALDTSARLPDTTLTVTPAPGARDAMPQTQISLLGAEPAQIGDVSVTGSLSGAHAGRLARYSQGDGESFIPARPFVAGETVTVSGAVGTPAHRFYYDFAVGDPDPIARLPERGEPAGKPGTVLHFRSAPAITPAALTVTKTSPQARRDGDIFIAAYPGPGPMGPAIFGPTGALVWFHPLPRNTFATDLRVQSYRSKPVLTWWQGTISHHGFGFGEGEIYSDAYRQIATVRAGDGLAEDLHELTLTSDGAALISAWKPLYCDLSAVGGRPRAAVYDTVFQEIDIKTGLVRYEWDSLEHVPLTASYMPAAAASPAWPYDWFHLNSVEPAADGGLLVSSRATWAVYDIDASTGLIRWQVGGRTPTYGSAAPLFAWQHDAQPLGPDLFSVFDNGGPPSTFAHSDGAVVRVDPATATASVIKTVAIPTPIFAQTQGDLQRLPDGSWWIGWGNVNESSQVAADGRQLFEAHTPAGSETYRSFRFQWSATPARPPQLALARAASGTLRAYVSWNGATNVAAWRVESGSSASSLRPGGPAIDRSGFETELAAPRGAAYVAAEALAANGRVLARTNALRAPR